MIVTPTASGKTLCYNAPVLQSILGDPSSRALVSVSDEGARAGSARRAPSAGRARRAARARERRSASSRTTATRRRTRGARFAARAHVVLSNPDMVHSGILPHHPRWAKLFENLKFVVIDELHAYRGVFGSHLANIVRRLQRVCRHYGSNPTFICSSATIANPRELAERLVGRAVRAGATRAARRAARSSFCSSIRRSSTRSSGIRRSYLAETRRVAIEFLKRGLQRSSSRRAGSSTEMLTTYLKDAFAGPAGRGRRDSRVSRRLPAAPAARDRARAAQRGSALRRVDERARARHRHRRARRGGHGRLSRARSPRPGSARAARAGDPVDRRPCSSRRARPSISSSCAIRSISSARRPNTRSSIRTTCTSCSTT